MFSLKGSLQLDFKNSMATISSSPLPYKKGDYKLYYSIQSIHYSFYFQFTLVLKDVRHVPKMCLNLISIGKLDEVGMINQFGVRRWKLTRGSMIVTRRNKEGFLRDECYLKCIQRIVEQTVGPHERERFSDPHKTPSSKHKRATT
ncbi:hypothetical protein CR513_03699, partial [Mucuna pruriens]